MVSREQIARAARARRALDDVDPRPVVPLHVEIGGEEMGGAAAPEIPRDGERLEEDFRQHHRAAEVEHRAALIERRQRARQTAEVAVAGGADGGAVGGGVLVDDLGADGGVHRDRHVVLVGRDQQRDLAAGQGSPGRQGPRQAFAHSLAGACGRGNRRVHLGSGLLGHAEASVGQPAFDVLARSSEGGELEVVDGRGAVEGHVGHHAVPDQRADQRTEADLHHVAADEQDDPAPRPRRGRDAGDDRAQIPRGEDVGQAREKRGERAVG